MTDPTWDRPADRVRQGAEAAYDRMRSNPALSSQARTALISEAYLNARQQMDALQQQSGQATATRNETIKRNLYGIANLSGDPVTNAVAFRDAVDRVGRLENPNDLDWLYESAEIAGDETLAQACFNVAAMGLVGASNQDIVNEFLARHPTKLRAYEALQQAQQPQSIAAAWEFVLPVPPELAGMSDWAIENAAGQASGMLNAMRAS